MREDALSTTTTNHCIMGSREIYAGIVTLKCRYTTHLIAGGEIKLIYVYIHTFPLS